MNSGKVQKPKLTVTDATVCRSLYEAGVLPEPVRSAGPGHQEVSTHDREPGEGTQCHRVYGGLLGAQAADHHSRLTQPHRQDVSEAFPTQRIHSSHIFHGSYQKGFNCLMYT